MSEWKPIESAPDDVKVLVFSDGIYNVAERWSYMSERKSDGWWDDDVFLNNRTHWMPLPAPPEGE